MRESVHVGLQLLQKLGQMVAVGGGVMAGDGQGEQQGAVPGEYFSRLHRGKEVVLQPIAVDGEVLEGYPGDAGDGIGIGGRRGLRLSEKTVISAVPGLVFREAAVKSGEIRVKYGKPGPGKAQATLR